MIIVNPNSRNPSPMAAIEPPIWCAYMAAHLEADSILDAEADRLSVEETYISLWGEDSVIVAMGNNPSASSTPKMTVVDELLKRPLSSSVAGLHPQALDYKNLMPLPSSGTLCKLKPRWDLLDFSKYRAHNWHCLGRDRSNYGVIYTSFGCPFRCDFCNIHTLYSGITFREPQDVVDEIQTLVETHHVKNLKLCDELFTQNPAHVALICDLLIERDYDLNIWAYSRVGVTSPWLLEKMKLAGFSWLAVGFECASGDVRQENNKRYSFLRETIDVIHDAGITIMGNFMFGLPGETMADMQATLDMAIAENFEYVNFYVALPYPGSVWYNGLEDKPTDWSSFDQYAKNICADPEVVKFRDEAFKTYFNRPEYLEMIERKFGARREIEEMLDWKIR